MNSGSKEYTKIFVSRKNLPLIHFVAAKASPRLYMLQAFHQSIEFQRTAGLCSELFQPLTERGVKHPMPGFGQQARLLNQLLIRT